MESTIETISSEARTTTQRLRKLAVRALAQMYRPDAQVFAFRRRRTHGGDELEGVSRRYTSTVLIALAKEGLEVRNRVLHGETPALVCGRMIKAAETTEDLGEAALALWAAMALEHPHAGDALETVRKMDPVHRAYPTVELAWALKSLVAGEEVLDWPLAREVRQRLVDSFKEKTAIFPHWPAGVSAGRLRAHVACFADFVYPIMALAAYARAADCEETAQVAKRCADTMCSLQGPQGQWWWHYDIRTGRVVEQFPVYAVHQDSMAPMALQAVADLGVGEYAEAIERGLKWLLDPPETSERLVEPEANVIWRKVARREPGKLARSLQAAASRVHPRLRTPGLDLLFRPGCVDYESRPYHMGWILYTWDHSELAA